MKKAERLYMERQKNDNPITLFDLTEPVNKGSDKKEEEWREPIEFKEEE